MIKSLIKEEEELGKEDADFNKGLPEVCSHCYCLGKGKEEKKEPSSPQLKFLRLSRAKTNQVMTKTYSVIKTSIDQNKLTYSVG